MTSLGIVDIGWLPVKFDATIGEITIATLPNFDKATRCIKEHESVEKDWIYAPPQQQHVMGHGIRLLPYSSRVFGLPKTHRLTHVAADGEAHTEFLVWALSFIFGLRLTSTEAGFLDATPIRTGKLTDFVLNRAEQKRAIALAECFWQSNTADLLRAKRWGAAVHALLLGQGPRLLQFEQFIYLYGSLDACFALAADLLGPMTGRISHASRIAWMCRKFSMPIPDWANDHGRQRSPVADLRNPTLHESLFMDAPLGFALHGIGTSENLTLEMEAMICRLLVALLGNADSDYVRTPVNTRQRHSWTPSL